MTSLDGWHDSEGGITAHVVDDNERTRRAYAELPEKIASDFRSEQEVYEGDYRRRQVFELIQNGADAIAASDDRAAGRVHILLTPEGLYCANEGEPFSAAGILSLRMQLWSSKRGNQIGRFGRGFKSVLALTDQPRVYSRSGSFTFSRRRARQFLLGDPRISPQHVGADADEVPILSYADPIDALAAARDDADLAELMSWATTVIHLPFTPGGRFANFTPEDRFELMESDLTTFQPEFLIFAKHVDRLEFEVRGRRPWSTSFTTKTDRREAPPELADISIAECEVASTKGGAFRWTLFELPPIAVPDGTERLSANRRLDENHLPVPIPLAWAVPYAASQLGRFWSFFPTRDETTLRGILNAPWDTNTERTILLDNAYNKYLIEQLASVVVRAVPYLKQRNPEDPGQYIEFLPARGREARSQADDWLTAAVNRLAAESKSLPDLDGSMRTPGELLRPPESVSRDALERWAAAPEAPRNFVHPSLMDPERGTNRGARVRLYMDLADVDGNVPLTDWLELLTREGDPASSVHAVTVAGLVASSNVLMKDRVVPSQVVLTSDGRFVAPESGAVFLPVSGRRVPGITTVHPDVVADPAALEVLRDVFGLREVDDSARLEQYLAHWPGSPGDEHWETMWELASSVAAETAVPVLRERIGGALHVRTVDKKWRPLTDTLLVGEIVLAGSEPSVAIDQSYHADHMQLLPALGASQRPVLVRSADAPWRDQYCAAVADQLRVEGAKQNAIEAAVRALPDVASHLHLVHRLGHEAAARLCDAAARLPGVLKPWTSVVAGVDLESPTRWFLRRFGLFPTSLGPSEVERSLSPGTGSELRRHLPVSTLPAEVAHELGLPDEPGRLPADVLAKAITLLKDEVDDAVIGRLLSIAVKVLGSPPPLVPCRVHQGHDLHPTERVIAVSDPGLFAETALTGSPVVLVPDAGAEALMIERWGMRGKDALVEKLLFEATGEPRLLTDEYFLLGELFGPKVIGKKVQTCDLLVRVVGTADGQSESEVPHALDEDTLVVRCGPEDHTTILRAVSARLGLQLDDETIDTILTDRHEAEIDARLQNLRAQSSDEDRVAALFSTDALIRLLPAGLLQEIECDHGDHEAMVKLAMAVNGPELLERARPELLKLRLQPPSVWGGSPAAMRFVRNLGFDPSYAGFKKGDRSPELRVPGPTDLKPLHDYQRDLADRVRALVRSRRRSKDGGWRGLLFLPTGAGKTRVAVQALLEMVEDGELAQRVILWIAESDELCEQAVQAFRQVWGALGTSGELVISRLWGPNHVEAAADTNDEWQAQVVVATVAKMSASVVGEDRYAWLLDAAVVVTDEAHQASSPEYTRMLTWLGTGVRRRGEDDRPLLGLTATPFKSGERATATLRTRFGRNLLQIPAPPGAGDDFSPTAHLRDLGVLARADHQVLDGVEVRLDDDELGRFVKGDGQPNAWLPTSVEGRIARDRERNTMLLDSIVELPDDWPVIVFAVSVGHAQALAAQLKLRGVEAAAISAQTNTGARHHFIREFRRGRTRVLTNYGVLTTGFDAPETRAIYVARPTFSVSLYMQMIGRGLRGPLNGGKDECLIVDVRDNIDRFGGAFAFDQVQRLWTDTTDADDDMDPEAWASAADDPEDE